MVPQSDDNRSIEIFPDLTKEKRSEIKIILNSMDDKIFTPIMESTDKVKTIEDKLGDYNFYLSRIYMKFPEIMEEFNRQEFLDYVYQLLRESVRTKVREHYTQRLILNSINLTEEHDKYMLNLFFDINKYMNLIEQMGTEVYSNIATKTSLVLAVIFVTIDRKHEALKELSEILKDITDELEPFVATFQVFLEPELAPLRERTSHSEFAKIEG